MKEHKIVLSDSEWMDLIDQYRFSLPSCCANISALRDCIITAARNGGVMTSWHHKQLIEKLDWYTEGHEFTPLLEKICIQIGWEATQK